jgi:uncharacterized RDD family membrane protein YckC
MDDAREWTATAAQAGAGAHTADQPGDPWGTPARAPAGQAVDEPDAVAPVPAGIRRRGIALAIDLVIVLVLWTIGTQLAVALGRLAPRLDLVAEALGRSWQLVVPAAYFVLGHGTAGQTLGKRLLGARVVDESGEPIGYLRALGRFLATIVAALPFGLGLAAAWLRRDRRGLHDLLAGTRVIRAR